MDLFLEFSTITLFHSKLTDIYTMSSSSFINSSLLCFLYYCRRSTFYYPLWLVIVYTPLTEIYNPSYMMYKPDILLYPERVTGGRPSSMI